MSSSSSVSGNYLVDRRPDKFGGNQAGYIQRSEAAIQSGVAQIRGAVQGGNDLKALFFTILDQFASERHAIAVDHRTEKAEHFGRKRMDMVCSFHFTPINMLYEEFNPKMLSLFQRVLKGKVPFSGEPPAKKFELEETCLGRRCYFEIELVTERDIVEREMDQAVPMKLLLMNLGKMRPDFVEPEIDESHFPPTEQEKRLLKTFNDTMKDVKANCPGLYRHERIYELIQGLDNTYPTKERNVDGTINPRYKPANQRNLLVFGKLRIEIQGKKLALSEYMTWACLDGKTDPVGRMKNAHVTILHQDRFLIEGMLQEIAAVFEKAVRCDSSIEKVSGLKDQVALIRYLFAHAMPFSRGSAAIGEWLEKTIYQYHGYECERNPETMGDLEALTTLWSTFRNQKYDGTIALKKK